MIKSDAAIMQDAFCSEEITVSDERRRSLARKGQLLYGKYCCTKGNGICAESFAEYHIWRGEFAVARDFLDYLHDQRETLCMAAASDQQAAAQLRITERLIARITAHLGYQPSPPTPLPQGEGSPIGVEV